MASSTTSQMARTVFASRSPPIQSVRAAIAVARIEDSIQLQFVKSNSNSAISRKYHDIAGATIITKSSSSLLLSGLPTHCFQRPHVHDWSIDHPCGRRWFSSFNRADSSNGVGDMISSMTSSMPTSSSPEVILQECGRLYDSLMVLNNKLGGMAIPPSSDRATSMPFCLLVGNHSSGKSSFINYVLERNIQKAGVAPTDDSFTVILPGPNDIDADGPTLVGDPDLGFASLRQFGPTLIHHTQLKYRTSRLKFMLIDSPGMIDSPAGGSKDAMDRGYDFPGVIRWLAQRADIVLVFFDPDKPGTTGETMSVLLNSLSGMDHKLMVILNKADQLENIHDFARAYGSLCWNLSKVIPRKDLPPIFTMSLPSEGKMKSALAASLSDLERTRDDVVEQVMMAPKRRVDNVISNLYDSTSMLILYSKIWNDVVSRYNKEWWNCRLREGATTAGASLILGGMSYLSLDPVWQGVFVGTSVLGIGGMFWYHQVTLQKARVDLTTLESLSSSFQRTHARQISDGDEFIASLWQRVRGAMQSALSSAFEDGVRIPTVSTSELQVMDDILQVDIPRLRRVANERHHQDQSYIRRQVY